MVTYILDVGADLAFVKDGLGHANSSSTMIYAWWTTATLNAQARMICASLRVV
jgi:site-specific recombinase XerD